ncbi:MAG: hypothetical protein IPL33_19110 [Sphingobacteriales bacterium]|nr:hypothetical protein [Sphingobacteriales bacterium]
MQPIFLPSVFGLLYRVLFSPSISEVLKMFHQSSSSSPSLLSVSVVSGSAAVGGSLASWVEVWAVCIGG